MLIMEELDSQKTLLNRILNGTLNILCCNTPCKMHLTGHKEKKKGIRKSIKV